MSACALGKCVLLNSVISCVHLTGPGIREGQGQRALLQIRLFVLMELRAQRDRLLSLKTLNHAQSARPMRRAACYGKLQV